MRLPYRVTATLTATGFALTVLVLLANASRADDVTTTAGKKLNGKLVGVDVKGISFSTKEAKVEIPGRDIVVVDLGNKVLPPPKDGTTFSEIELTDGSTIRVEKFAVKGKKFECDALPGPMGLAAPTYDIPIRSVFWAMKKAHDSKLRANWKKMLDTRGKRDLYVIELPSGLDYRQGTIQSGSDDGKSVSFENDTGGDPESLLQSRSAGYVFAQSQLANIPPTICRVQDVYGNSLNATSIAIAADSITVTTVAGATIKYPSTVSLARLDYAQGNVAYISDLDPKIDAADLPADELKLNPTVAFLKDRSLSNDAIKLDNVIYPKGLCVAPDTVLTFDLKGDYTQFKATVGIDENGANATSAAKLTIEADGQVLFTEALTRKDKAKGVVLTVKGVKQLRLIVEADTPLNGNYVTLADARVQK